ncbi:hypothetical protein BHE74_00021874 [Ensete ventricosum]|nr:hypothetical protein GW17_00013865 [Ensete ventricosum]RWW70445.1 hypothetical protein BHE74_00021874 [Ensete ventricosum]
MSDHELSARTNIFGLRLWVVISICAGAGFLLLFLLSLCLSLMRKNASSRQTTTTTIPVTSKEIQEVRVDPSQTSSVVISPRSVNPKEDESPVAVQKARVAFPDRGKSEGGGSPLGDRPMDQAAAVPPEVSRLGWGLWFALRELEVATDNLSDENVIGEGGYGTVYHGILEDGTQIAVKNLLNNKYGTHVEVEAIGRVRHKNLVRLLGYCVEGVRRYSLIYSNCSIRVNLIEWIKTMVSNRNTDEVMDPKMAEKPSSRTLKKTLLVALRCVDPDSQQRPKMGHVIHMLEVDDFPYQDVSRS